MSASDRRYWKIIIDQGYKSSQRMLIKSSRGWERIKIDDIINLYSEWKSRVKIDVNLGKNDFDK